MTSHDSPRISTWMQKLPETLIDVCQAVKQAGGKAWLVGGSVRDLCLGITPKDIDMEVYALSPSVLQQLAKSMGHTEHVGKHFGILKLWVNGHSFDLALPRTERKNHAGHTGFEVSLDSQLSPSVATLRRDFTINAMMFDPLSGELLDFHHGQDDLQQGILRHVSPAFSEDPLRVLRAMQFAARFRLTLAPETARMCQHLLQESETLSSARIWCEWQKWTHADYPAWGLKALNDSGWLSLYPELLALMDCPQDVRWHPEGDVWQHSLQVCNQAAIIAKRHALDENHREYLMFAALCHDLGKPETTLTDEKGHIRSAHHAQVGLEISRQFLQRIAAPKRIAMHVLPLVYDHMTHLCGEPSSRAIRRLAHRLEPASIELWEMLVEADASGRYPSPASRPALIWLTKAHALKTHRKKVHPLLTGKTLLHFGVPAGKRMGKIIQHAYEAQLDGAFHDEASALQWLKHQSLFNDQS
ncbi:MAG: HDIG domain-containing protein [Mariprofundaceae bacterium]|nr:HDIG domain-containing protein [Mariprofundaceae bacterium]